MACRLLAWSAHVRVKGEKLAGTDFAAGGARIELLEVPIREPGQCRLDTLNLDGYGWILATGEEAEVDFGGTAAFEKKRPAWIAQMPAEKEWQYGRGQVEVSYVDEAGSWEVATYRALLDLAFSFTRVGARRLEKDGASGDAFSLETDVSLGGLRVLKRWRDQKNAYVLVGVPAAGVTFHLGGGGSP
jgi:hypothetical protein